MRHVIANLVEQRERRRERDVALPAHRLVGLLGRHRVSWGDRGVGVARGARRAAMGTRSIESNRIGSNDRSIDSSIHVWKNDYSRRRRAAAAPPGAPRRWIVTRFGQSTRGRHAPPSPREQCALALSGACRDPNTMTRPEHAIIAQRCALALSGWACRAPNARLLESASRPPRRRHRDPARRTRDARAAPHLCGPPSP